MATARESVERHAKAAVEGKMDVAAADLTPEVMANIQPLVEKLGAIQPTGYEILSESKEGDNVVFRVKYLGKAGSVTVESTWALMGEAWKVVKGTIV
jgi:hypothetical protein